MPVDFTERFLNRQSAEEEGPRGPVETTTPNFAERFLGVPDTGPQPDVPELEGTTEMTPEQERLALEIGGAILGAGVADKALVGRLGLRGLQALGARALGSGAGSAAGSEVAQATTDPRENRVTQGARAFTEGAAGEVGGQAVTATVARGGRMAFTGARLPEQGRLAELLPESLRGRRVLPGLNQIPFVNRLTGPLRRLSTKDAEAAFDALDEIKRRKATESRGIREGFGEEGARAARTQSATFTPGQLSESQGVDITENIAEASLLGGGRVREARRFTKETFDEAFEEFSEGFTTPERAEAAGELLQDAIEGGKQAFLANSRVEFGKLDRLIASNLGGSSRVSRASGLPPVVDFRSTKALAAKIREELDEGVGRQGTTQLRSLLDEIAEKSDTITFRQAQTIRGDLLAATRQQGEDISKFKGGTKRLSRSADQAMEDAAREMGVLKEWRAANREFREGVEKFNSRFFRRIIQQDPDAALDAALRARAPGKIRLIRETVDPETWRALQGRKLTDLAALSTNEFGEMSFSRMNQLLKQFGGPKDRALRELFPGTDFNVLRGLAAGGSRAEERAGGNRAGSMLIQFAQAGALASLVFEELPGTDRQAIAVLLAPPALAFLMTRPTAAKWLTVGLTEPPGSRLVGRAIGQIATRLERAEETGLIPEGSFSIGIRSQDGDVVASDPRGGFDINPEPQERANAPANP